MQLTDLMTALGDTVLRARFGPDAATLEVSEVVLDDGAIALAPSQIVLAIRPGGEDDLVRRCADAGCDVVVVSEGADVADPESGSGPLVLETPIGWTQLFVLIRTMLLASHDEASTEFDGAPSSVHGLADAIAVMVGGSVVLYDRAHRVIAYAVHGHPIDDVRRDTILGRRTPDQWIERFTVDRTAYQTFAEPGSVVRVDDYSEMRTRLRIAVHAGSEIVGEISVAEGRCPFGPDAEDALRRAAQLAVPTMVRHRQASDVDAMALNRTLKALLCDGEFPADHHPAVAPFKTATQLATLAVGVAALASDDADSSTMAAARLLHFLSLHVRALSPNALVLYDNGVFYGVLPDPAVAPASLHRLAGTVLRQLNGMNVTANFAVGEPVSGVAQLPAAKRRLDDLLGIAGRHGAKHQTLTTDSHWAELVLLMASRGLTPVDLPTSPLQVLRDVDRDNRTDFVETLRVYLDSFGSVSASANRLFLHSNTLRHRLSRITELTGLDLDDPKQRLAVSLMLLADDAAPGGK
jgi:hypothetical protein